MYKIRMIVHWQIEKVDECAKTISNFIDTFGIKNVLLGAMKRWEKCFPECKSQKSAKIKIKR